MKRVFKKIRHHSRDRIGLVAKTDYRFSYSLAHIGETKRAGAGGIDQYFPGSIAMQEIPTGEQLQSIKRKIVFIPGINGNLEGLLITASQRCTITHVSPAHWGDRLPDDPVNTTELPHFFRQYAHLTRFVAP